VKRSLAVLVPALLLAPTVVAQRLPGGAAPDHYSLTFAINFATNSFDGDETIDLHFPGPSTTITLNALEIDFHNVTVTSAPLIQVCCRRSGELPGGVIDPLSSYL